MYNCDRPVFIFGCPRSGTSLLSRILNSHPRIGVPFESHFYTKFLRRLARYGDLSVEANRRRLLTDMLETLYHWSSPPQLEAALAGMRQPTLDGAVDSIIHDWCVRQGKVRWGEKTPRHALEWRRIMRAFPDAQVVHMIRDARDVAMSWKNAPFGPKHAYVAAQHWREFVVHMQEAREELPPSQFLEVKYEALVESPERTVRTLCTYLGEPYAPQMLAFDADKTPYMTDPRNLENLTRPLLRDNVYKWRRQMPQREVSIIEAVAKCQLERAGYEITDGHAKIHPAARLFYGYALHPVLRMRSMARNTKGQREALRDLWAFSKSRLTSLLR